MKHTKHTLEAVIATVVVTLALVLAGSVSAYPGGSDANHASNWDNQFAVPATCVKYGPGDELAPGQWYSKDGFIPDAGLVALILKSSTVNDVFVNPIVGNVYVTTGLKDISHIIICTLKEVTPSATPSATPPTPSDTPTPSATQSSAPSGSATPTPTSTPPASPSPTSIPSTNPTPIPSTDPEPTPSPTPAPSKTPTASPTPAITLPPTDTEG